jgi:hypothetical protein
VGYVRDEFEDKAKDVNLAASHIEGHSVPGEIFANMADAKHLAYDAWNWIFTKGKASPGDMVDVCARVGTSQVREE